ncbi:hypothetical protein [Rhizocola hellebori]|uniref:hypothetical protein n=1 Tax=Rhizocola hellebori TaxID=1392758 RepID=UPI00194140F2|nr:hypothetical protein [Rhizocola hellebori]
MADIPNTWKFRDLWCGWICAVQPRPTSLRPVSFLLYGLLDHLVDGHFLAVQQLDDGIEQLEPEMLNTLLHKDLTVVDDSRSCPHCCI